MSHGSSPQVRAVAFLELFQLKNARHISPKSGGANKPLLGCDTGGAEELGVIYFPTNWGAKEPQNLPNHRVDYVEAPVRVIIQSPPQKTRH